MFHHSYIINGFYERWMNKLLISINNTFQVVFYWRTTWIWNWSFWKWQETEEEFSVISSKVKFDQIAHFMSVCNSIKPKKISRHYFMRNSLKIFFFCTSHEIFRWMLSTAAFLFLFLTHTHTHTIFLFLLSPRI